MERALLQLVSHEIEKHKFQGCAGEGSTSTHFQKHFLSQGKMGSVIIRCSRNKYNRHEKVLGYNGTIHRN